MTGTWHLAVQLLKIWSTKPMLTARVLLAVEKENLPGAAAVDET